MLVTALIVAPEDVIEWDARLWTVLNWERVDWAEPGNPQKGELRFQLRHDWFGEGREIKQTIMVLTVPATRKFQVVR